MTAKTFRSKWIRTAAFGLPAAGIVVFWIAAFMPTPVDYSSPTVVAKQFITEVQANHPNSAYRLTSANYQKHVNKDEFSENFVQNMLVSLPVSEPEFFSISTPPDGKADKAQVILNIPNDGFTEDFQTTVTVVREGENWLVDSIAAKEGKAAKSEPKQSSNPGE